MTTEQFLKLFVDDVCADIANDEPLTEADLKHINDVFNETVVKVRTELAESEV